MMHERTEPGRAGSDGKSPCVAGRTGWERLRHFLSLFLLDPPDARVFHPLQYTFLSQIGHREDFRLRLANLYEEWRAHLSADLAGEMPAHTPISPRTVASFVQAILHGLAMQRAADPNAYDRQEMLALCLTVLGSYLGRDTAPPAPEPSASPQGNHERKP
jgi:hypothetical protein